MRGTRTTASVLALALALIVTVGAVGSRLAAAQEETGMTVEQTEAAMAAYAEALLGGGAYETYFAPDIVVKDVDTGQEVTGPAAAKTLIDALHHELFDATPEITGLVVGEGRAALEATFVGTHTGEFAGIAATGKEIAVPYSVFYELEDGKITALRLYALSPGLVQQVQAE